MAKLEAYKAARAAATRDDNPLLDDPAATDSK